MLIPTNPPDAGRMPSRAAGPTGSWQCQEIPVGRDVHLIGYREQRRQNSGDPGREIWKSMEKN